MTNTRNHEDPLVIGLTRPPMYLGVTQSFLIMNVFGTTIFFIGTASFWVVPLGLVAHLVAYLMCLRDNRYFDLLAVKIISTPPRTPPVTRKYLGGNTTDPY